MINSQSQEFNILKSSLEVLSEISLTVLLQPRYLTSGFMCQRIFRRQILRQTIRHRTFYLGKLELSLLDTYVEANAAVKSIMLWRDRIIMISLNILAYKRSKLKQCHSVTLKCIHIRIIHQIQEEYPLGRGKWMGLGIKPMSLSLSQPWVHTFLSPIKYFINIEVESETQNGYLHRLHYRSRGSIQTLMSDYKVIVPSMQAQREKKIKGHFLQLTYN